MTFSKLLQASALSLIVVGMVAACGPKTRKSANRPTLRPTPDVVNTKLDGDRTQLDISEQERRRRNDLALMRNIMDIDLRDTQATIELMNGTVDLVKVPTPPAGLTAPGEYYVGANANQTMVIRIANREQQSTQMLILVLQDGKEEAKVTAYLSSVKKHAIASQSTQPAAEVRDVVEQIQTALTTDVTDSRIALTLDPVDPSAPQIQKRIISPEDKSFKIVIDRPGMQNQQVSLVDLNARAAQNSTASETQLTLVLELDDNNQATMVVTLEDVQPPAEEQQPPAEGQQPPAEGQQPPAEGQQPPAQQPSATSGSDQTSSQPQAETRGLAPSASTINAIVPPGYEIE